MWLIIVVSFSNLSPQFPHGKGFPPVWLLAEISVTFVASFVTGADWDVTRSKDRVVVGGDTASGEDIVFDTMTVSGDVDEALNGCCIG